MNIKDRIDLALENEILRSGKIGSEDVRVSIEVSSDEISEFFKILDEDKGTFDNLIWWEIEDNKTLTVVYCEEQLIQQEHSYKKLCS